MEIREVFVDQVDVDENNPRQDMGVRATTGAIGSAINARGDGGGE